MTKQYYWQLLEQTAKIEKEEFAHNLPMQIEAQNLKALAFCGLLRLGESFQIESNAEEIEHVKHEKSKRIINNDNIIIPDLIESIKVKNMDNTVYSLDLKILKDILKSEYDTLVLKTSTNDANTAYAELDIEIPDIFAEEDHSEDVKAEPQEEKEPASKAPVQEKEVLRDAKYIPRLEGDMRYNHDPEYTKSLDTFCVNQVRLVYEEDGRHAVVDFNIFPLEFVQDAPITDIMAVAISGHVVRAAISRGSSAAVQLDFGELSFMARGKWEDGQFKTQVNCLNPAVADKFVQTTTEYMPEHRTYTTYMQEEFNHKIYSFFPSTINKNDDNGNVPSAMVSMENGQLSIILSNESDNFTLIDADGLPVNISLYWIGGNTPKLQLQVDDD